MSKLFVILLGALAPLAACESRSVRSEWLRPVLRGTVFDASGRAVPGTKVVTNVVDERRTPLPPVTTAADGTFAIEVAPRVVYDVCAIGTDFTMWRRVCVGAADPRPVELRERGSITLTGVVLDENDVPVVNAGVQAWREANEDVSAATEDGDPRMQPAVRTDAAGRFTIDVARHGRYLLLASSEGRAHCAGVRLATTERVPKVEGTLRLPRWATVVGRVLGPDGAPLVGADVSACAEGDETDVGGPSPHDRFGWASSARSDAEGRFAIRVHPDAAHTVVVAPNRSAHWSLAKRRGVAPGTADLLVACSEDELAGCRVRVFVTRSDGGEVDPFWFHLWNVPVLIDLHAPPLNPPFVDGAFELPQLQWNERYSLAVWAPESLGLASSSVEFTADRREMSLSLRLEPYAQVSIRVVDSTGAPAGDVSMGMSDTGSRWMLPSPVDDAGCRTVARAAPGPATVQVFDGWRCLARRDVVLVPGANADIVVRLPAR